MLEVVRLRKQPVGLSRGIRRVLRLYANNHFRPSRDPFPTYSLVDRLPRKWP
jgi:hypothetical protein